jgi:hypothetical protein
MRIIHIMQDGTKRDSVEGCVIQNKELYAIINGIRDKKKGSKA